MGSNGPRCFITKPTCCNFRDFHDFRLADSNQHRRSLADRLVMMTNGPAATIGEVMEIPFVRPRDRALIMEDPEYYKLRNYALDFLYNRFAHDDQ
jgi:hypothetical protein